MTPHPPHSSHSPRVPAGRALRLTVLVSENATWHHRPLYTEIVHRAHAAGLAGASVFRGIEGFGASSHVHTARLLSLGQDLPVSVLVVDTEERIRAFLPGIEELVTDGLVLLDACEVVRNGDRDGNGDGDGDGRAAGAPPEPGAGPAGEPSA
ncbi:hypothetical protein SLA_2461 [Streptomyces laurentii]|uniref:Uncharacterized protein n=1 Tax=Streptomyces laurentii TaxID=39478 RepID=A0A161JH01_STRLU|nr:hypothetical protein SLA_2461 [Streptomyces laurentii]